VAGTSCAGAAPWRARRGDGTVCSHVSTKVLNTVHSWWRFLTQIEGGVMLMSHFI